MRKALYRKLCWHYIKKRVSKIVEDSSRQLCKMHYKGFKHIRQLLYRREEGLTGKALFMLTSDKLDKNYVHRIFSSQYNTLSCNKCVLRKYILEQVTLRSTGVKETHLIKSFLPNGTYFLAILGKGFHC